jgi:hypothetical protein
MGLRRGRDQPYEYERLARYNAEVHRGLIHTPAYIALMRDEQARFDTERRSELEGQGFVFDAHGNGIRTPDGATATRMVDTPKGPSARDAGYPPGRIEHVEAKITRAPQATRLGVFEPKPLTEAELADLRQAYDKAQRPTLAPATRDLVRPN